MNRWLMIWAFSPDSKELWPLSRSSAGRVEVERLDVGNGDNGSTDHPRQTKRGVQKDETTNNEKIKMVARPFLQREIKAIPGH